MTEYGTQDMLHDLETLAAAGAYRSTSFETLFHAARAIAQDPMMNPGSPDAMMVTPSEEQQQNKIMELMTPLIRERLAETMTNTLYKGIEAEVQKNESRVSKVCNKYGLSRDQWDTLSPWEQSYYERDYEFR